MKNIFVYLLLMLIFLSACNQEKPKYLEEQAISTFDQMSQNIGEMSSCSYVLTVKSKNNNFQTVVNDVYMQGPDKLHIYSKGKNLSRGYWYNGSQFAYFDYLKSSFDTLPAPETIMKTIEAIHDNYGIDFPAADFFYPTFTDDMIDNFDSIMIVGVDDESLEGNTIIDIAGVNNELEVYFSFLKSDESILPYSLSIFKKSDEKKELYKADFSFWKVNPKLADDLFDFKPVENATRVKLKPKKQN